MEPQRTSLPARRSVLFALLAGVPAASVTAGECQPSWDTECQADVAGRMVTSFVTWDDGSGPAVYIGGQFGHVNGIEASRIARWNGVTWSAVGDGLGDGWEPPTTNVNAMLIWDDGEGEALYAAGDFLTAGDVEVNGIAKWDGKGWSALGAGFDGSVMALEVFDDGTGEALYAAGYFTATGDTDNPVFIDLIARWDGLSWQQVGGGLCCGPWSGAISLRAFDDGSGPALYAGGDFFQADGQLASGLARWDGEVWTPVGNFTHDQPAMQPAITALHVADLNDGPALYVGGMFSEIDGARFDSVARWDGVNWTPLGGGVQIFEATGIVWSIESFDDGTGPALYVGGRFTQADGTPAARIARWRSGAWEALGDGIAGDIHFVARLHGTHDLIDGRPVLYVGGYFYEAGGILTENLGRWNGCSTGSEPEPPR